MANRTEFDDIISSKAEKETFQGDWNRQRNTAKAIVERFTQGYDTILLADEVGMGKTYVALSVIAEHILQSRKNNRKVILITPPSAVLRAKWEEEILSFNEKYIKLSNPERRLRPIRVDGYWDLVQNLHDYENQTDLNRISATQRNCFLKCFFEWGVKREKASRRRNSWGPLRSLDSEDSIFLEFLSRFSLRAMFTYFDEVNARENKRLFQLIECLYDEKVPDGEIKELFRNFASKQDHYEANIYIMGMNSLKRPRSDKYDNQLLCSFILGLLLKGRWGDTRDRIIKSLEPSGLILRRDVNGRWEKYISKILGLSNGDLYGLKSIANKCRQEDNVSNDWQILCQQLLSGNNTDASSFFKNISDAIFRDKLKEAGVKLAVIDEVHNWKNGSLGAKEFQSNYAPFIEHKLIMSATPFQINEDEMQKLFGYVQMTEGRTSQVLTSIEKTFKIAACVKASQTFSDAWKSLSQEDSQILYAEFQSLESMGLNNWIANAERSSITSDTMRAFIEAMQDYRTTNKSLSSELHQIMIRHAKSRDKRHFHIGSRFSKNHTADQTMQKRTTLYATNGYANDEDAFINFIAIRLDQIIRRDSGNKYETNAHLIGGITSSTGAFLESKKRLNKVKTISDTTKKYEELFESILKTHTHPKVAATVERVFQNYMNGQKTLVFCERVATLTEISEKLKKRIENIETSEEGLQRKTLLKNHRFVDNLWWLSLRFSLAGPERELWDSFTSDNKIKAIESAASWFKENNITPNTRRIIKYLDLFFINKACCYIEIQKKLPYPLATKLLQRLFDNGMVDFVKGEQYREKESIEEAADDEMESDVTSVFNLYFTNENLWVAPKSETLHRQLWAVLESEAQLLTQATNNSQQEHLAATVLGGILIDLMEGLRKIALRQDLLPRYASRSETDNLAKVRDGFYNVNIGQETMFKRTVRFLRSLAESNGTINGSATKK